jgi:hypothetical protein
VSADAPVVSRSQNQAMQPEPSNPASHPRTRQTRALLTLAGLAGLAAVYQRLLRARILNWGATPQEVNARLPGDDLLDDAEMVATRAITVDAPPSAIWPWLAQMGVGRGGAYTYDWIERLFGLEIHNVDRIVPELQELKVGDVLPMRPNDPGMRVEVLVRERALSTRSEDGSWVWSFALEPHNGSTRLISRNRARVRTVGQRAAMAPMELGSLVMERKMLHTIKDLAEGLDRTP